MGLKDRLLSLIGSRKPSNFPKVVPRIARDSGTTPYGLNSGIDQMFTIPATFPFQIYDIIDRVSVTDPYIAKYVHTTVSLCNVTHKIYLTTDSERRANKALALANEFAARCYPFGGGMDGIVSGMLSQLARTGALCVEWAPDHAKTRIERGYLVPIKSLRFRYSDEAGNLELVQLREGSMTGVPLNQLQISYHGLIFSDVNPYPLPPILPALEACSAHREIMGQVKTWMHKISSLGVLLAKITSPPREPGETQTAYDQKAETYLQTMADTITNNLNNGLGIGYDNIDFQFSSTASGAQGAKDILQLVLQGMFSALQRDPIFFGWSFNRGSEALASAAYDEMYKSLKLYQIGVKRALEHGHRLNLALHGLGDIGISIKFHDDHGVDIFKESEANMMLSQAIISQYEAKLISLEEARKLLGYDEKTADADAFVAAFNKSANRYMIMGHERRGDVRK